MEAVPLLLLLLLSFYSHFLRFSLFFVGFSGCLLVGFSQIRWFFSGKPWGGAHWGGLPPPLAPPVARIFLVCCVVLGVGLVVLLFPLGFLWVFSYFRLLLASCSAGRLPGLLVACARVGGPKFLVARGGWGGLRS